MRTHAAVASHSFVSCVLSLLNRSTSNTAGVLDKQSCRRLTSDPFDSLCIKARRIKEKRNTAVFQGHTESVFKCAKCSLSPQQHD